MRVGENEAGENEREKTRGIDAIACGRHEPPVRALARSASLARLAGPSLH